MEKLVYAVSLTDLVTGPAKRMQKSLLDEAKALLATNQNTLLLEKSIGGLERAMVKSAATGDVKAYQKQARDLAMLRVAYDQADKSGLLMAESLKRQAADANDTASKFKAYAGVVTLAADAARTLAETTAGLVLAGAKFTLEAVQEKQAAIGMFRAMAGGQAAGDKLFDMMEGLAEQLPQTKTQLTAWSKEFAAMGILDTNALRADLLATASASALMGDEGVEAFTLLTRKITEASATTNKLKLADKQLASLAKTGANLSDVASIMGVSTQKLAAGLKAGTVNATVFGDALNAALVQKGKGPLDRLWGSLEVLSGKFKEAIGDMFEDVNVTPFVDAVRSVLMVFGKTEAGGKNMKTVIGGFFNAFFAWAGRAVLVATHFFLGVVILGLRAYIAIKPWLPLLKLLGATIAVAATLFLFTFAPAVWAGVVALGALVAELAIAAAPFVLAAALIVGVYEAFTHWGAIKAIVADVVAWVGAKLSEFATWAETAAENLIGGLVSGIASGAGHVFDAMKGLASGAIKSFEKTMGIASDSKVMKKLAHYTAHGYTAGLIAANDNVGQAASGLAGAAIGGASSVAPESAKPSAPAGGASVTVNVAPGAIVINGAQGDAAELTEHALTLMLEKVALTQGIAA